MKNKRIYRMPKNRLAFNLLANTISYSTTVLIAFFLTPYLVKVLGTEVYGFYPLANNFVNYISVVTVALNSMASRFITIEYVKGNEQKANNYFTSILYANIFISIIITLGLSILIYYLDLIINIPIDLVTSIKLLFALVFISMVVNIITSVFGVAVFVKNRIDLRSLVEIVQGVLRVLLYLILFSFFKPTIIYVGVVAVVLSVTSFILNFAFTKKLLPNISFARKYFNIEFVKEILSSGIWNSINQLGSILLFSVSLLIINIKLGANEAGEYAIVQTVPNFISGIISMLTIVFMPVITHKYASGTKEELINEVKYSQQIMAFFTNIPIIVFIVVGENFFKLWVPGLDARKLQIMSIMISTHLIFTGVTWPLSNLFTVMNKVKVPSIYLVVSGVINIILITIFIEIFNLGIISIPLASLVINSIWVGIFVPMYAAYLLEEKYSLFYSSVYRTIVGGVIIFIFTKLLLYIVHVDSWEMLLFVCFISGVFGLIVNISISKNGIKIVKQLLKGFTKIKK